MSRGDRKIKDFNFYQLQISPRVSRVDIWHSTRVRNGRNFHERLARWSVEFLDGRPCFRRPPTRCPERLDANSIIPRRMNHHSVRHYTLNIGAVENKWCCAPLALASHSVFMFICKVFDVHDSQGGACYVNLGMWIASAPRQGHSVSALISASFPRSGIGHAGLTCCTCSVCR